ncbi:MAG: hypothetical protein AMJ42_05485 [Deltaproteobacteria bacterium DG_8]|nr:MAG: hypothetical protein AMJ42_05485 [Deltaproteobacteria bacterium DG_8]
MKITIAKSAGFCFGVRRALKIAFKTVRLGAKVEMLGDIVHNEDVVREIEKTGIRKIKRLTKGNGKVLLIRAHGASKRTLEKANNLGYKIVDATCPKVKDIHKIAIEMEQKGYSIIVIGDKKHDEVHGIIGQIKSKVLVIDSLTHIPLKVIKRIKKAAVLVQSTQEQEKVLTIVNTLKLHIGELKFFNTICKPTRIKQEEIKYMPLQNDVMIIIGSKTSANTKRLHDIAKSFNKRSYWVQSRAEIKPNWFKNARNIGVTSGASTPDSTTKDIVNYIKQISPLKRH